MDYSMSGKRTAEKIMRVSFVDGDSETSLDFPEYDTTHGPRDESFRTWIELMLRQRESVSITKVEFV